MVQRIRYSAYGRPQFIDANGRACSGPTFGPAGNKLHTLALAWQGLPYDLETGISYNRARSLHHRLGRFLQRNGASIDGPLLHHTGLGYSGGDLNDAAYQATGSIGRRFIGFYGFWDGDNWFHRWVADNVWGRIHDQNTLANMSDAQMYGEAVGGALAGGAVAAGAIAAAPVAGAAVKGAYVWGLAHPAEVVALGTAAGETVGLPPGAVGPSSAVSALPGAGIIGAAVDEEAELAAKVAQAEALRDDLVDVIRAVGAKTPSGTIPPAVAGAVNTVTGEVGAGATLAGRNQGGKCAEYFAGKAVGVNPSPDAPVIITPAVRPRNGKIIAPCLGCKADWGL